MCEREPEAGVVVCGVVCAWVRQRLRVWSLGFRRKQKLLKLKVQQKQVSQRSSEAKHAVEVSGPRVLLCFDLQGWLCVPAWILTIPLPH